MASLLGLTKPHLAYHSDNRYVHQGHIKGKQTALRIQRAEAASANGFEGLGPYAAGIAAAAAAGVPAGALSWLGAGYVASRLVYNVVYVFLLQDNRRWAPLRSIAWDVSVGITVALWVVAGNRALAA